MDLILFQKHQWINYTGSSVVGDGSMPFHLFTSQSNNHDLYQYKILLQRLSCRHNSCYKKKRLDFALIGICVI